MKFNEKSGLYTASNLSFNPETCEGRSYHWYLLTRKVGERILFNDFNYSATTIKHKYKIRRLLNTLGIYKTYDIEAPRGLQNLGDAIDHYYSRIGELKAKIACPRTKHAKNLERSREISRLKHHIVFLQDMLAETGEV